MKEWLREERGMKGREWKGEVRGMKGRGKRWKWWIPSTWFFRSLSRFLSSSFSFPHPLSLPLILFLFLSKPPEFRVRQYGRKKDVVMLTDFSFSLFHLENFFIPDCSSFLHLFFPSSLLPSPASLLIYECVINGLKVFSFPFLFLFFI